MNAVTPDRVRSRASLATRSLLGAAWFELWFFAVFPVLVLWWSGRGWSLQWGLHAVAGAALIAGAHVALISEIVAFVKRGGGTHLPFDPPTSLISGGLYSRVRNPMYASYIAIAIGEAIAYRSWALLAYCVALAALIHFYVVRFEEPALRRRFGREYERFVASTGRWFPRTRGGS